MATIKTRKDYYKATKYFKPTQPNPTETIGKGKKGDCVIRAFALAHDISWLEAFDILCEYGRQHYNVPNDMGNIDAICAERGYEKTTYKAVRGEKRMTTEDFAKTHPNGRYMLKIANHVCACVNGVILDSWNPANYCVYRSYQIK